MKSITGILLLLVVTSTAAISQTVLDPKKDNFYEKEIVKEKEIIPYDHIREADVFWSKRVWRVIDVREKMNLPFKFPKEPLIQIIHEAAKSGELQVYDNNVLYGDEFKQELEVQAVRDIGYSRDTIRTIDPITLKEVTTVVENELSYDKIIKYRVKEDWFFDEETSTLEVRIIGIAPVMDFIDQTGQSLGDMIMYWVYYPHLRPILAKYEVYNPDNRSVRLSWEDVFEMRLFDSYIIKEDNVHDRLIQEYATGIDALLESDRITSEIRNFEHDLWSY